MLLFFLYILSVFYGCNAQTIKVSPSDGYVIIGEELNFTCTISYGEKITIGRIELLKDNAEQAVITKTKTSNPKNYVLSSQNVPDNVKEYSWSVSIPVSSTDDNGSYRCEFNNNEYDISSSNTVKVSAGFKPKVQMKFTDGNQILNPDIDLTSKSKFKIVCEGTGPITTLTMMKSDELVSSKVITFGENTVAVESPMYDVQQDFEKVHYKNFVCNITNNWGYMEGYKNVKIIYAPKNEMITLNNFKEDKQFFKPGTKLVCGADGFPPPKIWFETNYDKAWFVAGSSSKQLEIQTDLKDKKETRNVTCHAENEEGKASKMFFITINTTSVISVSTPGNTGVGNASAMVAGIVIAVIVILVLIGVAVFFIRRRLNSSKNDHVKYESAFSGDVDKVNREWLKANSSGSSKIRDVEMDDGVGQAPEKPARPSLQRKENKNDSASVLLPDQQQVDDKLHFDSPSFSDKPGSRQPLIDAPLDNGVAKLEPSRSRKGPPPGAYQLPGFSPIKRQSDDFGSSV